MAETGTRVALVLGTSAGGVGRHVAMLAGGLLGRGCRVVVAGPPGTDAAFGFARLGARFVPVPISDRPRPGGDLRAVRALRGLRRADAVHAHGLRAGALAALALSGTGAPLAVTLHNAATAGGAVGVVYRVLEAIVARRVDRVLVVSPDLGERMTALGARRVTAAVVPAPVLAASGRSPEEVRAELGAGDLPVLLTVARLAQQKGLETFLDAVARLASGPSPQALFLVAGDGPLREGLQRRIDREGLPVRLLGNRDDVADLLGVARALVVPSRWEGQPLSVQEALRAGTPVIATAVGGIPGMVGEGGLLVPYGDAAALADAVARVLGDDGLARRLAEEAVRRGRELPGEQEALDAVLEVYRGPWC
ncbi:glycosyltransferase family 4 protein [Planomonospora parontospora]|uniref:glycosyltransferase family 4 protein n=1 Tax=Planomonospora parontospora TaxID=58119 RepID=UPI00166FB1EE|nr:glycosyltransferase family 4 protein [Planomonospora parontospora]GGL43747.1 glycosyl transferase [Planomonospora parontospora subsp. antibiotica]GII18471.1 glycosyl transferase [Planomonospora parontospora subsp. antibiotica]